jgi:hypothetical protein
MVRRVGNSFIPLLLCLAGCHQDTVVAPLPAEQVQLSRQHDGTMWHLSNDGRLYREVQGGKGWVYHDTIFDAKEVSAAYEVQDETTYRVSPDDQSQKYRVLRNFQENFDDLPTGMKGLMNLVGTEREIWGSITLQSPRAPEVKDYVSLRNQLISGSGDFLDARIEVSDEQHRSENQSLRCEAPPRTSSMITCKASLSSPLVYFKQDDDFWFEAYYYVAGALPLTLADLESEFVREHAGIRLRFYEGNQLGVELKALSKPQYRQKSGTAIEFPRARWVKVKLHLSLKMSDGLIEVWQDDVKIVETKGDTLPFPSAIYNSLEIGASAYSELSGVSVVYVDDIRVSDVAF